MELRVILCPVRVIRFSVVALSMASVLCLWPAWAATSDTATVYTLYQLRITVKGTGSASLASPAASNTYTSESGTASGSFTVLYNVNFAVNEAGQTVTVDPIAQGDVEGTITASSLSGVDSYSLTTTCVAGSGCNTPPVTCSFSNVPISPRNSTATAYLQPTWGLGASHAAYAAGTVAFLELGGVSWTGQKFPCSNPAAGSVAPNAGTLPGLTAPTCGSSGPGYTLDIPIAGIEKEQFSVAESGSGAADSGCAIGTREHASYRITGAPYSGYDNRLLQLFLASGGDLDGALKYLGHARSGALKFDLGSALDDLGDALNRLDSDDPPGMPAAVQEEREKALADIKAAEAQEKAAQAKAAEDNVLNFTEPLESIKGAQSALDAADEVL